MGRDDFRYEEELMYSEEIAPAEYNEVKSPLLDAVAAAESRIEPLALEADLSEEIAIEFKPPGIPENRSVSMRKAIDAVLLEQAAHCKTLKINGLLDKAGAKQVHDMRIKIRDLRIHFEKSGKRQTEAAKAHIKNVKTEGDRFISLIEPAEKYLKEQEDAFDALVAADKAAKQKIIDDRNQGRVDALTAVGCPVVLAEIVLMSDATFNEYLSMATKGYNERLAAAAEEKRLEEARLAKEAEEVLAAAKAIADAKAAEEAKMAAERAAIAQQMAELEAQKALMAKEAKEREDKLAEERAKILADQNAIELERIKLRKSEEDRVAAVKAEEFRIAEEARLAKEAEEAAKIQAEKDIENAKAKELMKPDFEKIQAYLDSLLAVPVPDMSTMVGKNEMEKFNSYLVSMVSNYKERLSV